MEKLDDEGRKRLIIKTLTGACDAVQQALQQAAHRIADLPMPDQISATLEVQQGRVSEQLRCYKAAITNMNDSEFTAEGSTKLLQLITTWRDDLVLGIEELVPPDCSLWPG